MNKNLEWIFIAGGIGLVIWGITKTTDTSASSHPFFKAGDIISEVGYPGIIYTVVSVTPGPAPDYGSYIVEDEVGNQYNSTVINIDPNWILT